MYVCAFGLHKTVFLGGLTLAWGGQPIGLSWPASRQFYRRRKIVRNGGVQ